MLDLGEWNFRIHKDKEKLRDIFRELIDKISI